ncbi:MAG: aminopeptidase P family protein [Malacoplasma sp.]|nr:aminopeptidase P family protein [Malacoplasma sp.]
MTFKQYEQFIKPLGIEAIRLDTKEVRSIKCEEEIKYLQKAADIAVHALEETRKWIKIGVSESEVKTHLHNLMVSKGASGDSFDLIVAFGKNTANPHHIATNDKLKNNQFVTLDIGCIYNNYCSDITRTFFVGNKPTKSEKEIYNLILNAQQLGLKSAKVGTSGKALDAIVRNYIGKNKRFGKLFVHGLGHGVGIEIHEFPNINPKYDKMLSNNSVITIEPGVYEDNFAGVRIEDTIVITNKGIINLTKKAKKDFYK